MRSSYFMNPIWITWEVQEALQASPSVNLSVSDPSVVSGAKDGIAGHESQSVQRLTSSDIENLAPEHTNAQDFCLKQLREIITELTDEKADLMGKLSKSQQKTAEVEERLQLVTSECSKGFDEVCNRSCQSVPILHSQVLLN
jgi:type IV secretory pathway VirB4 component